MIARLNGEEIESGFERYLNLVRDGIAGFIIFGGRLGPVREGIKKLQAESHLPLVISSDLERGLGQQLEGGTVFPPAMALGRAWQKDPGLVKRSFEIVAEEAAYAGINTVFAPVLDIDLNPDNPIISTRAFGMDADTVSQVASAMIEIFINKGIVPCGKHFPGHGDTSVDSHMGLPVVGKSLEELKADELVPFARAITAGIPMIMTGHLGVPALDPTGTPVTLSEPSIRFLRKEMGYSGLITSDAMDMGAINEYGDLRAALMALEAGVDILLHPRDPESLSRELKGRCEFACRLDTLRQELSGETSDSIPRTDNDMVDRLSLMAIRIEGPVRDIRQPYVVALTDDKDRESPGARALASALDTEAIIVDSQGPLPLDHNRDLIVTVSSSVRAYKGGSAEWIKDTLDSLARDTALMVSMSGTNLIERVITDAPKIYAYWDSASSGRAVYEVLKSAGKEHT